MCVCACTHTSITMCMHSLETAFSQTKSNPTVHWWRVLSPGEASGWSNRNGRDRGCSWRTNYRQTLYKKCSGKTVAWTNMPPCLWAQTNKCPSLHQTLVSIYFEEKAISLWLKVCRGLCMSACCGKVLEEEKWVMGTQMCLCCRMLCYQQVSQVFKSPWRMCVSPHH